MSLLNLEPGMMVWAWTTFLALLFILYKIAWKPILATIETRETTIRESLEKAEKARRDSEELVAQHQKMIQEAEGEAQKIIKENRAIAEKSRQDTIEQARAEEQGMIEKARAEIAREKESALQALRTEVADLAISAAKQIIGDSLDEAKHRKLVEDSISKLPNETKH